MTNAASGRSVRFRPCEFQIRCSRPTENLAESATLLVPPNIYPSRYPDRNLIRRRWLRDRWRSRLKCRRSHMPITPFLDGHSFDSETRRVMGVAFELARLALGV